MVEISGQIGTLTQLLYIFINNGIDLFKTLDEIIYFDKNYTSIINDAYEEVKSNLTIEIEKLKSETKSLKDVYHKKTTQRELLLIDKISDIYQLIHNYSQPQTNLFKKLYSRYKLYFLKRRKNYLDNNFDNEKTKPFISLKQKIEKLNKKINHLQNNFSTVTSERFKNIEEKYNLAKSILKDNYSSLLGAIGEQKAVNELSKLPDSYYIINDFQLLFNRPIFHKESNSYIKSIQADHIVICPSGIFLIETKNWSKESIINMDLYSPIEQIKRTNYALFIYLNNAGYCSHIPLKHTWGQRKITVRNILLMINNKPSQEFQFVKILSLQELIGYIKYFKPVMSDSEVKALYKELLYNL
jgi:hypothetical protein